MKTIAVAAILAASFTAPAMADENHHKKGPAHGASATQPSAALSEGEVRKVDKEAKKLTLRHGPLQHLDMPAMTMVFQVQDPAVLDRVKTGDKVKFQAEKINGAFTVTQIEPAQ